MKKYFLTLVLFFLCCSNFSFAAQLKTVTLSTVLHSANKCFLHGKIYTQPDDVIIKQHGIFLNVGNQLLEVRGIEVDGNGLYAAWWNGDDEDDELWECMKCHSLNKMSRYKCKNCGWDRRN